NLFREITEIYAPLAERLGLETLSQRFRDEALKRMGWDSIYESVRNEIAEEKGVSYEKAEEYLELVKEKLSEKLKIDEINADVSIRVKSVFSIMEKMIAKKLDISELFDLLGIMLGFESEEDLWKAAGILHGFGKIKQTELKRKEKYGYEEFDMVIEDEDGVSCEFQFMTKENYEIYNHGFAAHWAYKIHRQTGQYFEVDKVKMTGDFREDFTMLKSSLDRWVFVFREMKKEGRTAIMPIRLRAGSIPADYAASRNIDMLNKDYRGAVTYTIEREAEGRGLFSSPKNKRRHKYALQPGDFVDVYTSPNFLLYSKAAEVIRHNAKCPRTFVMINNLKPGQFAKSVRKGERILMKNGLSIKPGSPAVKNYLYPGARELGLANMEELCAGLVSTDMITLKTMEAAMREGGTGKFTGKSEAEATNLHKGKGVAHEEMNEKVALAAERDRLFGGQQIKIDPEIEAGYNDKRKEESSYINAALNEIKIHSPPLDEFIRDNRLNICAITPQDGAPLLVTTDQDHFQALHIGLRRNVIYIGKGLYERIKRDHALLAAAIGHEALEIKLWHDVWDKARDEEDFEGTINEFRDRSPELIEQFHKDAEVLEREIAGKSKAGEGSRLDDVIRWLIVKNYLFSVFRNCAGVMTRMSWKVLRSSRWRSPDIIKSALASIAASMKRLSAGSSSMTSNSREGLTRTAWILIISIIFSAVSLVIALRNLGREITPISSSNIQGEIINVSFAAPSSLIMYLQEGLLSSPEIKTLVSITTLSMFFFAISFYFPGNFFSCDSEFFKPSVNVPQNISPPCLQSFLFKFAHQLNLFFKRQTFYDLFYLFIVKFQSYLGHCLHPLRTLKISQLGREVNYGKTYFADLREGVNERVETVAERDWPINEAKFDSGNTKITGPDLDVTALESMIADEIGALKKGGIDIENWRKRYSRLAELYKRRADLKRKAWIDQDSIAADEDMARKYEERYRSLEGVTQKDKGGVKVINCFYEAEDKHMLGERDGHGKLKRMLPVVFTGKVLENAGLSLKGCRNGIIFASSISHRPAIEKFIMIVEEWKKVTTPRQGLKKLRSLREEGVFVTIRPDKAYILPKSGVAAGFLWHMRPTLEEVARALKAEEMLSNFFLDPDKDVGFYLCPEMLEVLAMQGRRYKVIRPLPTPEEMKNTVEESWCSISDGRLWYFGGIDETRFYTMSGLRKAFMAINSPAEFGHMLKTITNTKKMNIFGLDPKKFRKTMNKLRKENKYDFRVIQKEMKNDVDFLRAFFKDMYKFFKERVNESGEKYLDNKKKEDVIEKFAILLVEGVQESIRPWCREDLYVRDEEGARWMEKDKKLFRRWIMELESWIGKVGLHWAKEHSTTLDRPVFWSSLERVIGKVKGKDVETEEEKTKIEEEEALINAVKEKMADKGFTETIEVFKMGVRDTDRQVQPGRGHYVVFAREKLKTEDQIYFLRKMLKTGTGGAEIFDCKNEGGMAIRFLIDEAKIEGLVTPSVDEISVNGDDYYLGRFEPGIDRITPQVVTKEMVQELVPLMGMAAAVKIALGIGPYRHESERIDEIFKFKAGEKGKSVLSLAHQAGIFSRYDVPKSDYAEKIAALIDNLVEFGDYVPIEDREEILDSYFNALKETLKKIKRANLDGIKDLFSDDEDSPRKSHLLEGCEKVLTNLGKIDPEGLADAIRAEESLNKYRRLDIEESDIKIMDFTSEFAARNMGNIARIEEMFKERGIGWSPEGFQNIGKAYPLSVAALLNGDLVGYVVAGVEGSSAVAIRVSTMPELQGLGIGTKLICAFARRVKKEGRGEIIFESLRGDDARTMRFFKNLGFRIAGVDPDKYREQGVLLIRYRASTEDVLKCCADAGRRKEKVVKDKESGRWPVLKKVYDAIGPGWAGQALAPAVIESGLFVCGGELLLARVFGLPFAFAPPAFLTLSGLQLLWHLLHGREAFTRDKLAITGLTAGMFLVLNNIVSSSGILFAATVFLSLILPHVFVNVVTLVAPGRRSSESEGGRLGLFESKDSALTCHAKAVDLLERIYKGFPSAKDLLDLGVFPMSSELSGGTNTAIALGAVGAPEMKEIVESVSADRVEVKLVFLDEGNGEEENMKELERRRKELGAYASGVLHLGAMDEETLMRTAGELVDAIEKEDKSLFFMANPDLVKLNRKNIKKIKDIQKTLSRVTNRISGIRSVRAAELSVYNMRMTHASGRETAGNLRHIAASRIRESKGKRIVSVRVNSLAEAKLVAEAHRDRLRLAREDNPEAAPVTLQVRVASGRDETGRTKEALLGLMEIDDIEAFDLVIEDKETGVDGIYGELSGKGYDPENIVIVDPYREKRDDKGVPEKLAVIEYKGSATGLVYDAALEFMTRRCLEIPGLDIERRGKLWFILPEAETVDTEELKKEFEEYRRALIAA
ncbi:MAG: GNAT family N-acetyltransferase, partial [Candidatus Omnitrophica bacterium]|nr:GNAT family N-acetyltransferase [Candidatus Omnitrophota bacterium]